jgi:TonB-linked SusC/RagA family outer membrane protein
MKLMILFLMVGLVQVSASVYSQTTRLTLEMRNSRVVDVLEEIERQSEFRFAYSSELIDMNRRISVAINEKDIEETLKVIFEGTGVKHIIRDRHIMLYPQEMDSYPNSMSDQQKSISGKVTDTKGLALPGVSVVIKGTTQGTVTNFDGQYTLTNLPDGATLVFSFVGMRTREEAAENRQTIDVVLEEETIGIDEVVVTALGLRREEKALGYSVQKVGGETLSTVKGIDVSTSLTGKIAGLFVKNSSEFASEPDVQIRGENPLLVIDGVPYGNMVLRDIPSDDIEDISVLKGATASALYGYRGESGAIMVTTKKGMKGKGLTVTINSGTMMTAGYLAIPEMQSTYGRKVNAATNTYVGGGDGSWGPALEGQEVIQWDPVSKSSKSMPYLPVGKDNFKNFLEQGYILNNNISVVQQGEYGSLRSSATWVRNKGQYPNSMFDKITYTLGGDMKLNKFTLSSSISYNKQTSPNIGFSGYTGYDPMYNLLVWSSPDYDIRQYKDYWLVKNESQNNSYTSTNNNPYFDRYERIHSLDRDIFNGFVSMGYELTPWLSATFRSGFDTYSENQVIRISVGSYQGGGSSTVIKNGTQVWGESKKGSFNMGLGRGYSINNDFLLTADKTFGDFALDGLVGGTMYFTRDEGIESRTQGGLSIPGFYSLKASVNPVTVSSSLYRRQVNSLFGRLSVSWKNMLFVEGTLRNDWSSTLPEITRSYLYPSVASSFILSEVLPEMDWLSFWKVRGSWTSSKTPAGVYSINSVYSITTNAWGNMSSATYPTAIRGTDVRPESSSTFEIGSLINIYRNRASIDVAYYSKRMYDFLRSASISPASGFASNYINIDEEITRRGVEVTANVTPVKTNDWQWDLSFNWTKYARYYTQLDSVFTADRPWIKEGERVDHYTYNDFLKDPQGNIIYNNGLPVYSSYASLAGYSDPDWIWGLSSALTYKNFTFNLSVDGRVGGLAQTTTEMYMWTSGNHPESVTPERYLDVTQPGTKNYTGDGVKVISGEVAYDTYGNITSDTRVFAPNDIPVTYENYVKRIHKGTAWGGSPSPYDLYSTTFFKVREMSVTYQLPASVCSKIFAKSGSISAVGQNVLFWAKDFKYSDPDGGSENFSDPSQRYLGINLKVNF